jgi:hypothetical protein
LHLWVDADFGGDLEEVAGVLAGHVGNAADLAFAPEELVVVEGGHLVEVDGVDGDDAAFAEAGERADDDSTAGREGDGAIECDGRFVVFCADPLGARSSRLGAVGFAAGGDVDLAVPVAQDVDGERGGGAEAEEADALSRLSAGDAKAAKADDAGAEEGSDVGVIEGVGEWVGEVGADEDVFGIAAVDGVAGEDGVVAEVFFAAAAEGAGAVGSADPGDADAHVVGAIRGGAGDDLADDLMAEDERPVEEAEVALGDVEVGAADSAGKHAEEDMALGEDGDGDFFQLKRLVDGVEDGCSHRDHLANGLIETWRRFL